MLFHFCFQLRDVCLHLNTFSTANWYSTFILIVIRVHYHIYTHIDIAYSCHCFWCLYVWFWIHDKRDICRYIAKVFDRQNRKWNNRQMACVAFKETNFFLFPLNFKSHQLETTAYFWSFGIFILCGVWTCLKPTFSVI